MGYTVNISNDNEQNNRLKLLVKKPIKPGINQELIKVPIIKATYIGIILRTLYGL